MAGFMEEERFSSHNLLGMNVLANGAEDEG